MVSPMTMNLMSPNSPMTAPDGFNVNSRRYKRDNDKEANRAWRKDVDWRSACLQDSGDLYSKDPLTGSWYSENAAKELEKVPSCEVEVLLQNNMLFRAGQLNNHIQCRDEIRAPGSRVWRMKQPLRELSDVDEVAFVVGR